MSTPPSQRDAPIRRVRPGLDGWEAHEPLPVEMLATDYARRVVDDDAILMMDRPPAVRKSRDVARLLDLLDSLDAAERRSA